MEPSSDELRSIGRTVEADAEDIREARAEHTQASAQGIAAQAARGGLQGTLC